MGFQADFLEENGYCVPDKWYMNATLDIFLHLMTICEVTKFFGGLTRCFVPI